MDNLLINPTGKYGKYIFTGLILLIIGIIVFVLYKMFIEFKDNETEHFLKVYADKYGSQSPEALKILRDGAKNILLSYTAAKQVKTSAKASGMTNEFELAHAAYMDAVAKGYLAPVEA